MVCLGIEPGAAGWKAQTNPLSYGYGCSFYFKSAISQNSPKSHQIFGVLL